VGVVAIAVLMQLGEIIKKVHEHVDCLLTEDDISKCSEEPSDRLVIRDMMTGQETSSESEVNLEQAQEEFQEYRERYDEREESMGEAFEKANESMWELLEILTEWAEEEDDALLDALTTAEEAFGDGDYAAVAAIFLAQSETIGQAPAAVWDKIGAVLTPLRAKTCYHLNQAELAAADYEAYGEVIEAMEEAGATHVIPLMAENWDRIEQQNELLLELEGVVCAD